MAFATNTGQMYISDGTSWLVDSSYFVKDPEEPNIGMFSVNNKIGYGRNYVTDKDLANCYIGQGQPPSPKEGSICFTPSLGTFGQFQQYSVGAWHPIVAGLVLTEVEDMSQAITRTPIGKTQPIIVFSGDSVLRGLNNVPLIKGYVASIGVYPPQQIISGGTF